MVLFPFSLLAGFLAFAQFLSTVDTLFILELYFSVRVVDISMSIFSVSTVAVSAAIISIILSRCSVLDLVADVFVFLMWGRRVFILFILANHLKIFRLFTFCVRLRYASWSLC